MRDGVPGLSEARPAPTTSTGTTPRPTRWTKSILDDFRKNMAALAVMSYVIADMPGRLVASPPASGRRRQ